MLWFQDISFRDLMKAIVMKNDYLPNFSYSCIKSFLNKLYTLKIIFQNILKRNVFIELPFLGRTVFQIRKQLQKLCTDNLLSCNLKIVFTSPVRVKGFFIFKDKLPKILFTGLVQSITVVATMLPIMLRPNAILKSEFVNIQALHISLEKR